MNQRYDFHCQRILFQRLAETPAQNAKTFWLAMTCSIRTRCRGITRLNAFARSGCAL